MTQRKLVAAKIIPQSRRLWIYTTDPMAALSTRSLSVARTVIEVPWEEGLAAGPTGECIAVLDHDPASGKIYAPVDLSEQGVLARDGLAPSVENPKFHQQMAYAVAMRIVSRFERVLGRRILWADRPDAKGDAAFVQRLLIYPHALRGQNAYYSPDKVALLFGYFRGLRKLPNNQWGEGSMVFTCLSFDVLAHETTHAILDGINPRLRQSTNPDVLAFHEAFSDIVALFERLTMVEFLRAEITRARGRLSGTELGELAKEFGHAMGYGHALRDFINSDPEIKNYITEQEPHDRGAVLVAAVFDAFTIIYNARICALTAIIPLPEGQAPIHPALVNLLVREARKAAEHVLTMCIRAIDYMPPVDIRFSDFLRALITADADHVQDDEHNYRIAFIEAFSRRYIFAEGVRSVSEDTLRWKKTEGVSVDLRKELEKLNSYMVYSTDRREIWQRFSAVRQAIRTWLLRQDGELLGKLGLDATAKKNINVESARLAQRMSPDGQQRRDVIVVITQQHELHASERAKMLAAGWSKDKPMPTFLSGSTIIISLDQNADDKIRYVIWKNPASASRRDQTIGFLEFNAGKTARTDNYGLLTDVSGDGKEPFAMLHQQC